MPRPPSRAPYDFECDYTHCCPYLDGLSTHWIYSEYRHLEDRYQEHLQRIDAYDDDLKASQEQVGQLEKENAELKAQLAALHRRQFKANRKKESNESDPAGEPAPWRKKKRGAPVGHPGWTRPRPARIDRTVTVAAPSQCPHCQGRNLLPLEEEQEHLQEDIVLCPQTTVTRFQHQQSFCVQCNRSVYQAGEGEMLNAPIGPVAKSTAIYLRYQMGLSYRKVQTLFRDLFGLNFVPASAVGFDRKAAHQGTPLYQDLREKIRASSVIHADETSWRNDGTGHYVWFAGNEDLAFFQIDRHRSQSVAHAIFGKDFQGILVRDRYAAYHGIGAEWQSCWAHINTKAKEIGQQHELLLSKQQESAVTAFVQQLRTLCSQICAVGQQLKNHQIPWEDAAPLEKMFRRTLNKIGKRSLAFGPAETLRSYLVGPEQKFLFTFLRQVGVPPTNNLAEQSLRPMVIFRKILFGTRSNSGLGTHSILPSLLQTARRQGVDPKRFFAILLTADTQSAQAALYHNSS
jgi:transposase